MIKLILYIYDRFRKFPVIAWLTFLVITIIAIVLITRLQYKEDISDFLPLDEYNQTSLSAYQDISGANKIYAIVHNPEETETDPERLIEGIDEFTNQIEKLDSNRYLQSIIKEIDLEEMMVVTDSIYSNLPYFLTPLDYQRLDSLLAQPDYINSQLSATKEMLLFPTSNIISHNISRDPLNLFSPVMSRLKTEGLNIEFENYNGYIFTPDMKRAIVIMESSFGARESENNGQLLNLLNEAADSTKAKTDIDIILLGGPVIAVTNADRIKTDSIIAVAIAGILIIILLIYVFRNIRNILLIIVSVGWGWLIAMGAIAVYYDSISIIVIGIASVILGIAVNYPLHLIDHLKDSSNPRKSLREIISPLLIGNITTVGAFLCLIPLNAPALHDLGLFSSLLLIGTIIFVLVYLPHAVKTRSDNNKYPDPKIISYISNIQFERNRWLVWIILSLTLVFAFYGTKTEFDTDMQHINYMTSDQHEDMEYFQKLLPSSSTNESLYAVSNGRNWDEALSQNELIGRVIDSLIYERKITVHSKTEDFIKSNSEQDQSLQRWHNFITKYPELITQLRIEAKKNGFASDAFLDFENILNVDYKAKSIEEFKWLTNSALYGTTSSDDAKSRYSIIQPIYASLENVDEVRKRIENIQGFKGQCFDVKSMNSSMADTLSDDFNYIGYACGFIVFLFLWITLGSLELALMSFLPMALSWIWILGIMGITGLSFNIVNIILATFIFGQGDDYTIFITEGLISEYAYQKKLLTSYKNSITVSALIMFIGIGSLVFALHPAMKSLGQITIVGMLSVVVMAYMFPPLIFNWLVKKDGAIRLHPITFRLLWWKLRGIASIRMVPGTTVESVKWLVMGRYLYKGIEIEYKARSFIKDALANHLLYENIEPQINEITLEDKEDYGISAMILALLYPDKKIIVINSNEEYRNMLYGCAKDMVYNIVILPK